MFSFLGKTLIDTDNTRCALLTLLFTFFVFHFARSPSPSFSTQYLNNNGIHAISCLNHTYLTSNFKEFIESKKSTVSKESNESIQSKESNDSRESIESK